LDARRVEGMLRICSGVNESRRRLWRMPSSRTDRDGLVTLGEDEEREEDEDEAVGVGEGDRDENDDSGGGTSRGWCAWTTVNPRYLWASDHSRQLQ
jgi:hypothetical protein